MVLEKKISKGFYHILAWQPSWSCDPDLTNKLIFTHPKGSTCNLVSIDPVVSEMSIDEADNTNSDDAGLCLGD